MGRTPPCRARWRPVRDGDAAEELRGPRGASLLSSSCWEQSGSQSLRTASCSGQGGPEWMWRGTMRLRIAWDPHACCGARSVPRVLAGRCGAQWLRCPRARAAPRSGAGRRVTRIPARPPCARSGAWWMSGPGRRRRRRPRAAGPKSEGRLEKPPCFRCRPRTNEKMDGSAACATADGELLGPHAAQWSPARLPSLLRLGGTGAALSALLRADE